MQKMLSYIRRACDDYNMIEEGDVIAVGGDGTLHEVLNGIVNPKECKVGLIPLHPQTAPRTRSCAPQLP